MDSSFGGCVLILLYAENNLKNIYFIVERTMINGFQIKNYQKYA